MKNLFANAKATVKKLWSVPLVSRALHTFWQGAFAYFTVSVFAVHSSTDAKIMLIGAVAAGLSAIKTMAVAYVQTVKATA